MYKLLKKTTKLVDGTITEQEYGAFKEENGFITAFLFAPDNTDYQQYLKWVEEGNTPLPADEGAA
jgi:hypothetical protein